MLAVHGKMSCRGKPASWLKADSEMHLLEAVHALLSDPNRLKRMGTAARQYMESRSFESAFDKLWEMYQAHQSTPT